MKRFTETNKWEDRWFSRLSVEHKLAWLLILDRCDNAGVIDIPGPIHSAMLGDPAFDWEAFKDACNSTKERLKDIGSDKWWIVQFIQYQYKGGVSSHSKQHGPIRDSIDKYRLPIDYLSITQSIPKGEVSNTSQDKDKDKDKDKDQDKETETHPKPRRKNLTESQKKRIRVAENTEQMIQVGAALGRKPETLWTIQEAEALQDVNPSEDEIKTILEYYQIEIPAEKDYRRRQITTLLNNWMGELDKAKLHKLEQK